MACRDPDNGVDLVANAMESAESFGALNNVVAVAGGQIWGGGADAF
jgi:hypothetical protein